MPATIPHTQPDIWAGPFGGSRLDSPVRACMTPGVVTLTDDSPIGQAFRAMSRHSVHGVLVVGRLTGTPLGWVTADGLVSYLGRDYELVPVSQAISQDAVRVQPSNTVKEAAVELSQPGISHLLVAHINNNVAEGVVTAADLVAFVGA